MGPTADPSFSRDRPLQIPNERPQNRIPTFLVRVSLFVGVVMTGCPQSPPPNPPASEPLDLDQVVGCAPCHQAVFNEWKESLHAQSHHTRDPIYAAIRNLRRKKEGKDILPRCANCHTPRAPDAKDGPKAFAGVSCAACHTTKAIRSEERGAAALISAEPGVLMGPHPPSGVDAPHQGAPPTSVMTDGTTLCLACHGHLAAPSGVPICTTGSEAKDNEATCVSCHMPKVDGSSGVVSTRLTHRSHRFWGPRATWTTDPSEILTKAVALTAKRRGRRVTVTLKNTSGHGFPSGFPARLVTLTVASTTKKVWTSKPVRLGKIYHDADGNPTLAPYAAMLALDSRLTPNETRTVEFKLPPGLRSVEARAEFWLLPSPLAEKLSLKDTLWAEPKVFWRQALPR